MAQWSGWLLPRKKGEAKGGFPVSQFSYISPEQRLAFAGLKPATQGFQLKHLDLSEKARNPCSLFHFFSSTHDSIALLLFLLLYLFKAKESETIYLFSVQKLVCSFFHLCHFCNFSGYTQRGAHHLQKDGLPFTLQCHDIILYFPSFLNNSHYFNHILACF